MKMINPTLIKCDPSVQARFAINDNIVTDYMEDMKRGDEFPPVIVFWDGKHDEYILADGFHRFCAWQRLDAKSYVPVKIKLGTESDARWYAICANKDNGYRRSNADKRRAVELALLHPRGSNLSNVVIARYTGVSHTTVQNIRKELEATCKLCKSSLRTGADGRAINTTHIGGREVNTEENTCGECRLFYQGRCVYNNEPRTPNKKACLEFQQGQEKTMSAQEDLPFEFEILEGLERNKARKRNTANYCSRVGTPFLLPDSSKTAAIEIRHLRGEEWLADLFMEIGELLEK